MKVRSVRVALAVAAGAVIVSGVSFAQKASEVVVEAPAAEVKHTSSQGRPMDIITVRHRVGYGDIDISTSSGAKVLEQRIKDAAKEACNQIDTLYPNRPAISGDPPCEKTAVDRAMVEANAAIAAAEKAAHK